MCRVQSNASKLYIIMSEQFSIYISERTDWRRTCMSILQQVAHPYAVQIMPSAAPSHYTLWEIAVEAVGLSIPQPLNSSLHHQPSAVWIGRGSELGLHNRCICHPYCTGTRTAQTTVSLSSLLVAICYISCVARLRNLAAFSLQVLS